MTDQKTTPEFPFNGVDVFYIANILLALLHVAIIGWLALFGAYAAVPFFAGTLLTVVVVWIGGAVVFTRAEMYGKAWD